MKKFSNPKTIIDINNRTLDIEISKPAQRVVITGSEILENWEINILGVNNFENEKVRYDKNLLTGCLTLYKIEVLNIDLNSDNLHCEDSINILNSKGKINNLTISNSNSDSLDIDFFEIDIFNLKITNSGNDCADFSSGKYLVSNYYALNCKDKGISIGEGSNLILEDGFISNSEIGLAIKDSSYAKVNKLDISESKLCLAMYRKKQEFGPSKLVAGELNCFENSRRFIQSGSVFDND